MTLLFKRSGLLIGLGFWASGILWAADSFSDQLTTEEFASAGLHKLTPEERVRLNTLIRQHETGELARARREATAAEAARIAAEKKAAEAEAKITATPPVKAEGSWLKRITLKPGTEIDYETVETEMVGNFAGWRPGTVFTFANGQRWRVVDGTYVTPPETGPRRVKIVPGMFGSFFLEFTGIRSRPKATFAGSTE
ncbi:MAG TPA: hypothetical protein PLN52_16480 [Opitutaceae bacterium]|nr:hypothetical protein [Opitutaceae bacterium]